MTTLVLIVVLAAEALAFRRSWTRRALTAVAFGIYLANYATTSSRRPA